MCLYCRKKNSSDVREITDNLQLIIQKISPFFRKSNIFFPLAICTNCRLKVTTVSKENMSATSTRISFEIPDYVEFAGNTQPREDDSFCECTLCCAVRKLGLRSKKSNKRLDHRGQFNFVKKCSMCHSEIAKGKSHKCNTTTKLRKICQVNWKSLLRRKKENT